MTLPIQTANANSGLAAVTTELLDPPMPVSLANGPVAGPISSGSSMPPPAAILYSADPTPSDPSKDSPRAIGFPTGPTSYASVIFLADILEDLMKVRIANQNRVRSLTSLEDWGKGIPAPDFVNGLVGGLETLEHQVELALKRAVRQSPLGEWVKATPGVGEKGIGRLLKEIGDPAWNFKENRARTLRELYAYCGLHVWPAQKRNASQPALGGSDSTDAHSGGVSLDPSGVGAFGGDAQTTFASQDSSGVAPFRSRGTQSNWSTAAKTRLYTTAEACMKNRNSAYRAVYDQGRHQYAQAVHRAECRRCGPSGKPAEVGSSLSAGHQHARAMRLVMKAILKDLWQAARGVHSSRDAVQEFTGAAVPAR